MTSSALVPMDNVAERVFKNNVIVKVLMKHLTEDPMSNLHLRFVSSEFNKECLRMIRDKYHSIKISKPRDLNEDCAKIHVNGKALDAFKMPTLIEFLKDTVGVKLQRLEISHLYAVADEFLFEFIRNAVIGLLIRNSRDTLKYLTGIHELCQDGCIDCTLIAPKCKEYGPMQWSVLQHAFKEPVEYETLHIDERLLCQVASKCAEASSEEACMALLNQLITPLISASHLFLHHCIQPAYHYVRFDSFAREHQWMPQGVLEQMITTWQVKTMKIVFENNPDFRRFPNEPAEWQQHFQPMQFDVTGFRASQRKLEKVELEVRQSGLTPKRGFTQSVRRDNFFMMSAARRLFPSDNYIVSYIINNRFATTNIPVVLESVMFEFPASQKNSTLTLKLFPQTLCVCPEPISTTPEGLFGRLLNNNAVVMINQKSWILGETVEFSESFEEVVLDGVRFPMEDSLANGTNYLNVEVFKTNPWGETSDY